VISCRIRSSETYRAREIALVSDLDDREAGVLLMVRTYPTIMGTAIDRLSREYITLISWLVVVLLTLVIRNISRDEDSLLTMFETMLDHVDPIILEDDFGIDGLETLGADGTSEFVEDVRTDGHRYEILRWLII
jgi:hypothetical protein